MYVCDSHIHTHISPDSKAPLAHMVRAAVELLREAGFRHSTTFIGRKPVIHSL